MNQLEEYELKNERLEEELAELKDEIKQLKNGKESLASEGGDKSLSDDPYLKEELHQVKLELKDANNERTQFKKQL